MLRTRASVGVRMWCLLAIVVGLVGHDVGGSRAALAVPGERAWVTRYDGPANRNDDANAIAVSPDGRRVFVTGASEGHFLTIAYRSDTGVRLWSKRWGGEASAYGWSEAIAVSPDGRRVYVTGTSGGVGTRRDLVTIAYRAETGAKIWKKRYDGPARADDVAAAMSVSPQGTSVFVLGSSEGSDTGYDFVTIAYAAATGRRLWVTRGEGPSSGYAEAMAVDSAGTRVFVAGSSEGSNSDYLTAAYRADTGAEIWRRRSDGPAGRDDHAYAVAVDPGGRRVFVTGSSPGVGTGPDYVTVAYRADAGKRLWMRRYGGTSIDSDYPEAMSVGPDGRVVFVTGAVSRRGGDHDFGTVAYAAATGSKLWARRYDGPARASDHAYALTVSPDGAIVLVTGGSEGSGMDYATIAYDAERGREGWIRRYGRKGDGNDYAYAIAPDPAGEVVFVTGVSQSQSSFDVATVAYWLV